MPGGVSGKKKEIVDRRYLAPEVPYITPVTIHDTYNTSLVAWKLPFCSLRPYPPSDKFGRCATALLGRQRQAG